MTKKSLKNTTQEVAIYVHFPFCKNKCKYCTFDSCSDYQLEQDYFDALVSEIASNKRDDVVVSSIFFGGGTPSSVSSVSLQKVFDAIYSNYKLAQNCEITVECNPESLTLDKAQLFAKNKVNRVSIGLQSANDSTLQTIGRVHNFDQFVQAVNNVIQVGITNINADIIIGLPETLAQFKNTVNQVINLPITHVSAYALEVYPGTQLDKEIESGKVSIIYDEDQLAQMYDFAHKTLSKHGFSRYEVSNFAKKGYKCNHNLAYWRCKSYFGFGASAHGYIDGVRYENVATASKYIQLIKQKDSAVVDSNLIDLNEQMDEYVMLGLRLDKGISVSEFYDKFAVNIYEKYPNINKLIELNLLKTYQDSATNQQFIAVKPDKFYVLNEILTEIL